MKLLLLLYVALVPSCTAGIDPTGISTHWGASNDGSTTPNHFEISAFGMQTNWNEGFLLCQTIRIPFFPIPGHRIYPQPLTLTGLGALTSATAPAAPSSEAGGDNKPLCKIAFGLYDGEKNLLVAVNLTTSSQEFGLMEAEVQRRPLANGTYHLCFRPENFMCKATHDASPMALQNGTTYDVPYASGPVPYRLPPFGGAPAGATQPVFVTTHCTLPDGRPCSQKPTPPR
eukprot:TRINITY_DN63737_c0_g1_i1.p1 TRINITY_DN63737_c0_g1~~TRINITY_DN63737_c0_g1_i1.p1  ORF type:complete len:229 (-),score=10.46 TRINITY_DN63737_c0_g1_i1:82-768(-)